MKTKFIFKGVLLVWLILWVVFLIRQSKHGQYEDLAYFYSNGYDSKVQYLLGDDLADFLSFCAGCIPEGATYDIKGFEKFSIKEVRARYYLWPLYRTENKPDFIIVYGAYPDIMPGYLEFRSLQGKGAVYIRREDI